MNLCPVVEIFLHAGEIHELKQIIKNSESKIMELGAQVHKLEMDCLDKDTCIEKYTATVKHQEGECK